MTRRRRNRGSQSAVRTAPRRRSVRQPVSSRASVLQDSSEHFVDLTCEDTIGEDQYVDLTAADSSVVVVPDTPTTPLLLTERQVYGNSSSPVAATSPLLLTDSSDSEAELPAVPFSITRTNQPAADNALSPLQTSTVFCPVCLDSISDIKSSGRHIMATRCGHVFCSLCIEGILRGQDLGSRCPTCRKKLNPRIVHQLFI